MADRGTKRTLAPTITSHAHKRQKKDPSRAKYRAQAAQKSSRASISQNAIQAGDVGLFLTSDKGKEKAALREMEDLLEAYMEDANDQDGTEVVVKDREALAEESANYARGGHDEDGRVENGSGGLDQRSKIVEGSPDIEDEISAELDELKGTNDRSVSAPNGLQANEKARGDISTPSASAHKLGLITLDIPCVSFVRFPSTVRLDPVAIVLEILREAAAHPNRPRSRFIKRMTPVTKVRKVLNQGLDELAGEVLPAHFSHGAPADSQDGGKDTGAEEHEQQQQQTKTKTKSNVSTVLVEESAALGTEGNTPSIAPQSSCRYKVDVTRRQSDHLSRDEIIQTVADHVNQLGHGQHRVDLRTWEKAILVEVYRGIVGMSVIDIGSTEWEGTLKKGNLAEVYAAARQRQDNDRQKS